MRQGQQTRVTLGGSGDGVGKGGQQWVARVRAAAVDPTVGSSVVGLSEKDPSGGVDLTLPPSLSRTDHYTDGFERLLELGF